MLGFTLLYKATLPDLRVPTPQLASIDNKELLYRQRLGREMAALLDCVGKRQRGEEEEDQRAGKAEGQALQGGSTQHGRPRERGPGPLPSLGLRQRRWNASKLTQGNWRIRNVQSLS